MKIGAAAKKRKAGKPKAIQPKPQGARKAVWESEGIYRTLFEHIPVGLYRTTPAGEIVYANPALLQMLGYPDLESLRAASMKRIYVDPEDRRRWQADLEAEGLVLNREMPQRRRDGVVIWVRDNARAVRSPEGRIMFYEGVMEDITARKQMEEALRDSEGKYRNLVERASDGICVLQGGIVRYANPRMVELSGYTADELIGSDLTKYFLPEHKKFLYERYQQRLAGMHVPPVYEAELMKKSGEPIALEINAAVITYEGAKADLVLVRNLEERRKMEKTLRESESKYRTLFAESKDLVFIADNAGRLLDLNPAGFAILGFASPPELATVTLNDLFQENREREAFDRELSNRGFVKDFEVQLKRRDGAPITGLITASRVADAEGRTAQIQGIIRDVNELKKLEQQFFQAQKMESIGTMAAGIAHDFNNILGGILGHASLLKSQLSGQHPFYEYVDTIESGAKRGADLTSKLLTFAHGGRVEKAPLDVNALIRETLNIISRTFDRSIAIRTDLAAAPLFVDADAGQIQQALMNLFVNARDAMPSGGELLIESALQNFSAEDARTHIEAKVGPYAMISVSDTGLGIDRATQQKIFEPFFTTKESGKGTGLGLTLVYGVVKNHGGFVKVYSEVGKGSTFRLYLPVGTEGQAKIETEAATGDLRGTGLILVVDDEADIRKFFKRCLTKFGYQVLLAQNGEEAVALYQSQRVKIDLVILDMVMPVLGGAETFLKLKDINPEVKVLLSTGYSPNGNVQEILDLGVLDFIQKPYHVNKLLSKIKKLLKP